MTQHKSAQTDAVYSLEISSPTSEFQFCFVENLFRLAQSKKENFYFSRLFLYRENLQVLISIFLWRKIYTD